MPNDQLARLKQIRDLAGTIHRFGWTPAKTKSGGIKAVGTGPDAGKKPLYGKRAEQALARSAKAGGETPAAEPDEVTAKILPINKRRQEIQLELAGYGGTPADPGAGLKSPRWGNTAKETIRQLLAEADELNKQAEAIRDAAARKSRRGGETPATPPEPAAPPFVPTAEASGPTTRPVPVRRSVFDPPPGRRNVGGQDLVPGERPPGILPDDKPKKPGTATPPAPAAVPPAAVEKELDAAGKDDEAKYGKEQASVLRLAARTILRGMNVLGGGLLGAAAGFGLSGGNPIGLAVGGIAGLAAGARPGLENLPNVLRSPQRMRAGARQVARAVAPRAAGAAAALPAGVAGTAATVGLPVLGAAAGGVPGALAGLAGGLAVQGSAYEAGANAGKRAAVKVRNAMVTSPVSVRKAKRANRGVFSELTALRAAANRFADAVLDADPVTILKRRIEAVLARLGIRAGEIPDHVIQKALEQAAAQGGV